MSLHKLVEAEVAKRLQLDIDAWRDAYKLIERLSTASDVNEADALFDDLKSLIIGRLKAVRAWP